MTATIETLLGLDARLADRGSPRVFPPGSWWVEHATAFYTHPTAREWWGEIGRGGAKSTVIYRVAENEALFGDWVIPPGERHWATIASRNKDEASKAIGIISSDLAALGVRFEPAGDAIELLDAPRGFRIIAASVGAGSGWRSFFAGHDELAKWPRDGSSAVDATEVIASMRAMTLTHRHARRLYFSSPFGVVGPHYERVRAGPDASTVVSSAASWVANPSLISEAQTHELEPNERIWLREYAAIPQSAESSIFRLSDIERAMEARPEEVRLEEQFERVLVIDWARVYDARAYAIVRWTVEEIDLDPNTIGPAPSGFAWCMQVAPRGISVWDSLEAKTQTTWLRQDIRGSWFPFDMALTTERRHVLEVEEVGEVPDKLSAEKAVDYLADLVSSRRFRGPGGEPLRRVLQDQYEVGTLGALLRQAGLRPVEETWTGPSKQRAVDRLERLLRDSLIRIPKHEKLRRQLSEYSEKITRSGAVAYAGRGAHDDLAAALVTAAMGDVHGDLPGSPSGISRTRYEVPRYGEVA